MGYFNILKSLPFGVERVVKNNNLSPKMAARLLIDGKIAYNYMTMFHELSQVYSVTNEPIGVYLGNLNMSDKSVLTVAAGADFALTAAHNGANEVSTFDISIFTKYYQDLKINALTHLSYDEFLNFCAGYEMLNFKTYEYIREFLDEKTKDFWDYLYKYFSNREIVNSGFFISKATDKNELISKLPYLKNESTFLDTKKRASKLNFHFYNLDLLKLGSKLQKSYDIIFISNILQYIREIGNSPINTTNFIRNNLANRLNKNGIVIATIFNPSYRELSGPDFEVQKADCYVSTLTFHK